jgi:hypothetical protein
MEIIIQKAGWNKDKLNFYHAGTADSNSHAIRLPVGFKL